MPPIIQSSGTIHVNTLWVTMPPVVDHTTSGISRHHSKHGGYHARNATYIQSNRLGRILSEERQKRYDHQPGRRRAVYEELETTQTTSIKRIPAVHRYQIFPNASSSFSSSGSLNKITRNASWRFTSGAVRPSGNKEDVNLMIIPFGALFLFIVVCLLYISRWCIDDIREADRAIVTVTAKRQTDGTTRYVNNQSSHPRRNESCDETSEFVFGQSVANYNRSMAASQLNVGGRRTRTMRIAPARSTRSLNGLRGNSSGERLTRSAIRRINNAGSSSSSIPLTDLSSTSTLLLGSHRTIEHDEIVESCRRAVGNLLQNHIVVVPVDMTGYAGQFTGAGGGGRTSHHSTRVRTRNNSSPAAATFSTAPAHRTSGIACEHSPVGGNSEASQTGSYCSDSRPLLGRYSSSSDGRIQLAEERMTSSDSNIDAKTGSPGSSRRRLQAMDNKRRGIACASNVINKKTLGVAHQSSASRPQRRCPTYQQQYSVPAVSKLVYDSLNLSFRFFQVPAAVESSYSSSGKESLDSVFMGGGVIATDEVHSSAGAGSSSRRATHPNVERTSPCSGARLPPYEDQTTEAAQQSTEADFIRQESQNNNNAAGLSCDRNNSCDSAKLQVVTVHRGAETAAGEVGTRVITLVGGGGGRSFAPSIGRRSSSTAESAIYSASASADTLPGAADAIVHSRLSESDRIKASSSSSASLAAGGRAATRRSMSSSELHLQRLQDEHANGVTGE